MTELSRYRAVHDIHRLAIQLDEQHSLQIPTLADISVLSPLLALRIAITHIREYLTYSQLKWLLLCG